MLYPPDFNLESNNFLDAWEQVVRFCIDKGYVDSTDTGLLSKDINSKITLTGKAIQQIKNRELHKKFPTGKKHLSEYILQFTDEFNVKESGFVYTYRDRLINYPTIPDYSDMIIKDEFNQLEHMRNELRKGNRRSQAITWIPRLDNMSDEPPCAQRLWLRVLEEPDYEFGIKKKGMVELHLMWRSRDIYTAWPANIIAMVFLVYNEILEDDYEIVKLLDFVNSAHINENDWDAARLI